MRTIQLIDGTSIKSEDPKPTSRYHKSPRSSYPVFGQSLISFVLAYGSWAVFFIVMLESAGIPLPGETILIAASVYAGASGQLDITTVVFAAATGAIIGDSIGYWIGRKFGFALLLRYGSYISLREPRLKLGQYLFLRYGGRIVFFGRFVAALRVFAALLAGANHFPWLRFLFFNASGGVIWASIFGFGGYIFGESLTRIATPIAVVLATLVVGAVVLGAVAIRRREEYLQIDAEKALPGPLLKNILKRQNLSFG